MKVNLCIDASYLLYKNVFILKKYGRLKQDLKELLDNDLDKISKTYHFDNIYFCSDSKIGNWRKQIYKEYKGKREKDETIDWDFVYGEFDTYKENVKTKKNIKFLELPGLEADDFIAHVVRNGNKNGYSFIILSSDGDLQQLLKYDLNEKWMNVQWNYKFNDERVYLPENYQLVIEELANTVNENVFELDNSADFVRYIEDLTSRTKVKPVTREEVSVIKIVWGDKGDNIPTCVKVKDGKIDSEGRGIGKDGAKTVYNLYKEIHPETIDLDSDEFLSNLADVVIYYKKIKDPNAKEQIIKQLEFNRMMIFLDPKYMPDLTHENMVKHFESVDNRVIEYEPEDLEAKLEEDDFFAEEDPIPEQFNMESDGDSFDPDSFWDL